MKAGRAYGDEIIRGIESAKTFVLVLSKAWSAPSRNGSKPVLGGSPPMSIDWPGFLPRKKATRRPNPRPRQNHFGSANGRCRSALPLPFCLSSARVSRFGPIAACRWSAPRPTLRF